MNNIPYHRTIQPTEAPTELDTGEAPKQVTKTQKPRNKRPHLKRGSIAMVIIGLGIALGFLTNLMPDGLKESLTQFAGQMGLSYVHFWLIIFIVPVLLLIGFVFWEAKVNVNEESASPLVSPVHVHVPMPEWIQKLEHYSPQGPTYQPKYLTEPPFAPPQFLGRDDVLNTLHKLFFTENIHLFMVYGEGGMGKSSLAGEYWKKFLTSYQHMAFCFVGNGIANALLELALPLGIRFEANEREDARLNQIIREWNNRKSPKLLILDNADNQKDYETHFQYLKKFQETHLLVTSRNNELYQTQGHRLPALEKEWALKLFRVHYPDLKQEEEALFWTIYEAIEGNTLVLEILAKNLKEANPVEAGYTLQNLSDDILGHKLLHLKTSAQVKVDWKNHPKAKPEDIIAAMYDIRPLSEHEKGVLSHLAVLPPEHIALEVLKTLIHLEDKELGVALRDLVRKGWLVQDALKKTFKISPVVQQVVRDKNPQLLEDCTPMLEAFNEILDTDLGQHLVSEYETARLYAALARSVIFAFSKANIDLRILCQQLGNFHTITGDLGQALQAYEQQEAVAQQQRDLNPNDSDAKNGLAVAYQNLGDTHSDLGDLKQALKYFEQFKALNKELYDAFPNNVSFKNGLAVSYSKLGETHTALGDLKQALKYFELETTLFEKLYDAFPNNVSFKYGLAISYSKLGETHTALGDLIQALNYFELDADLSKELYDAFPNNVSFKNGLAVSYSKLGETHSALGNLKQALKYFEQYKVLKKELYDAFPNNVSFKNGLAISYEKLGDTYSALGDLIQALKYFELRSKLGKELYDAFPNNVSFKNGLAISYAKLGETHSALGDLKQALKYFELDADLSKKLYDAFPNNVSFKNGLAISFEKLGETHKALGDLIQALKYFELRSKLGKELYDAFPNNVSFKNGLAISYAKLGETHSALGDLKQALKYFELDADLSKELYDAFPNNVSFKNGLAISYSKLGETHSALGDLKQALNYFEQYKALINELYDAFPNNVSFKYGLAASYSKLGVFYRGQKQNDQARPYFEQAVALWTELVQDAPMVVAYQRFLATARNDLAALGAA